MSATQVSILAVWVFICGTALGWNICKIAYMRKHGKKMDL